jgi:signal transduction histidine kinase
VGDFQRSIELVDDLRAQADRLVHPSVTPTQILSITQRIAADARAYDPLANSAGEREEWGRLQRALDRLQEQVQAQNSAIQNALVSEIGRSVERIVVINREAAHAQAEAIRAVHRSAFFADATAGVVSALLVSAVAFILLRVLARQRALTERHIALLDEKNRELDAFAGRAAHDLRIPLNPIRGYADLLLAGDEPPAEIRQMASRIRIAVDRMSRVVDDMLELSRAGRPGAGEASPAQVGAEVLEELGPELMGVEVKTELTDERVACAPGVLAQILRNLIGNAVKFRSRHRRLSLLVGAYPKDSGIELVLEDNGLGMDRESAAHAFEPYYRGRSDREVPGHGLGLAIVERTTRALGGSCSLVSAPDRGTRIVVRLPAVRPRQVAALGL